VRWTQLLLLCLIARTGSAQDFTFLTYNIRYDNEADSLDRWDLRKEALADEVMRHKPHVIGLQEALAHQLTYLDAKWPRYRRYGIGREDGALRGEFSPVYYDTTVFTLVQGITLWLAPDPIRPGKGWDAACERIATVGVLRDMTSGDSLWVVNTHWDHEGKRARRNSAAMIEGALRKARAAGQRFVIMGDLNTEPGTPPIRALRQWTADACPVVRSAEGTFNGFGKVEPPYKRIDYILFSPGRWEVIAYDVLQPVIIGRQLSDHFPVITGLRPR